MLGAVELGFVPNRGRGHHSPAAAPLPPCAKAICGSDYAPRGVTLKWGPASRNYQRCLFLFLVHALGQVTSSHKPIGGTDLNLAREIAESQLESPSRCGIWLEVPMRDISKRGNQQVEAIFGLRHVRMRPEPWYRSASSQ